MEVSMTTPIGTADARGASASRRRAMAAVLGVS